MEEEVEGSPPLSQDMMANESNILGLCIFNTNYIQQLVCKGGAKFALNQSQCTYLAQTLEHITKNITNTFSHANGLLNNIDLLLKELFRVIERAKLLVQQCYDKRWWHATLLQIHNQEAFQDLFMDLKSCYEDIFQHLKGQWAGQLDIHTIDVGFSLPIMRELGDEDHRVLMRQLQLSIKSTHPYFDNEGLNEELTIVAYLLERYDNQGKYVNGGHHVEVDARLGWGGSIPFGEGAYGSVEKTTWFGLPCAKKVQVLSEMEEGDKTFKKEVAILASANHPNVIKFICCGQEPEKLKCFIAMELPDTNLEKLIKELSNEGTRAPFTIQVAVDIILQIAKGMSYLHELKIAHMDLKPKNVLVHKYMVAELHKDNYVNVKLANFGMSIMDCQDVGTRLYKTPEPFQNTNQDTKNTLYSTMEKVNGHEDDVYRFGVICATILSGEQLSEGMDHDLLARLRSGQRLWVPEYCPEALVSLINDCWSLNRTKIPKFKEICTTLKDLRSYILRGDVAVTNQEVKNVTTVIQRTLCLPHNVLYLSKHFWKKPNLKAREANKAQHASQIHTKLFTLSSWANRLLPSQVRLVHSFPTIPIHFINIDEKVSNVLFHLEGNQILGIVGMGGSGKTTLTKVVLHRVHQGFEATSFVANMRDSRNVLDIQRQLLKDLDKDKRSILSMEEGFKCLQDIFEKRKVFVVLDDVSSQEQLHALVSSTWVFANGSKIIATSRNWQDLKNNSNSHIGKIDMELLDENQAKELFYKCAFSQQQPQKLQFEEVANKVIKACCGLPLSLEVLGSYLCGVQRLRDWEQALQRLQRGQGLGVSCENDMILWRMLKISYDSLNEGEKNIFLDIACFFCRDVLNEGMQEEKALKIWDCDDDNADLALLNLMDQSLVQIDSDGMLTMHDCLRDMGRMIAYKEHIGGQRIWNLHEFEPIIPDFCTMLQNVRGLHIDGSHSNYHMIASMNLANMRLLHINNCEDLDTLYKIMENACNLRWMHISMSLENNNGEGIKELQPTFFIPLKQLRVLEMKMFVHLQHLPLEVDTLENLEYLGLFGCKNLETVSESLGNLTSLVTLDLRDCVNLKDLPKTLSNLTKSLVTLNLCGCSNLKELPETLGDLIALVILNLRQSKNLKELPASLGNLTSLDTLDLSGCLNLKELPETLGNMTSLVTLNLHGCSNLKELPETLGNMTSLVTLNLHGCSNLKELPETLGNMTSLYKLDLSGCLNLKELPKALGNMTSLVTLNLHGCSNLKELPETSGNMTSLVTLNLHGCWNLKELPETLGNMTSLVTLNLHGCWNLKELPETLGDMTSLVTLNLHGCSNLKELPKTLGNLTSLVILDFSGCSKIKDLPKTLGNLTSMGNLDLSDCSYLKELPETFNNMTSLVTLSLRGCLNLKELPQSLGNLISLHTLDLSGCSNLEELPKTLGNMTSLVTLQCRLCFGLTTLPEELGRLTLLTTLDCSWCSSLTTLSERLGNLTSLTTLKLQNCSSLTTIPKGLGNLTSLTTLNLQECSSLTRLPEELGNLISLITLNLWECSSLTRLPEELGNLTSLTTLNLRECLSLTTLPKGLGNLTSLTTLDCRWCSSLRRLPEGLGNLISLTSFELCGCSSLTTLPEGLGNLTSLTTLNLRECLSLTTLPKGLGNLTSLTTLDCIWCSSLTTLPEGLGNLTSLTSFELWGCSSLTTLPEGLGNLTSLTTLNLRECLSLTTLPKGLGNLTSLTTLDCRWCSSLTTLPEGLGNLTSLTSFELWCCSSLTILPEGLGNLTSLTTLKLWGCSNLTTLPEGLGNLTSLTPFELWGCSSLTTLPEGLGNLTSLTTLNLQNCSSLTTLPEGLGNLTSLTTLNLRECSSLTTLSEELGNLTSLITLNLWKCSSLTTLPEGLGNLTSLTTLNLRECSSLRRLPEGLGNLTSLTTLNLRDCSSLIKLPKGLGNLTSLATLNVHEFSSSTTLSKGLLRNNIKNLKELMQTSGDLIPSTTLDLSGCSNLEELPETLGNMTSLETLDLNNCKNLKELPKTMGNLISLETLDLNNCKNLKELPETLGNLTSLVTLDLTDCSKLEELPKTLGNMTLLVTLNLRGCSNLKELPETLDNLTLLGTLDLSGCSNLKKSLKFQSNLIASQESQSGTNYEEALSFMKSEDLDVAGSLTRPENTESRTSLNESLDLECTSPELTLFNSRTVHQAKHDALESLEKLKKAWRGSALTMQRTLYMYNLTAFMTIGGGVFLHYRYGYTNYGVNLELGIFTIVASLVMLYGTCTERRERLSLKSLWWLGHGTFVPCASIFAMAYREGLCSFAFFICSTILGVSLLVLILGMRRSVHFHLLWYNATGKSLRPCNMLKAQYYSQNLRGALFISKDAPHGSWSYHPDFSWIGQKRVNSKDVEDEFEVSGYTYKCRYQYPMSYFEVTMQGKLIKSMETRLACEVHDMFIRLIRRWERKAEDGVFYGMQIVWGVNVTHCLDVEELYKLLVEGHVPVQYVNGPYTKALVMCEREILDNIIKVIVTIMGFLGVMYVNYGGCMVINGMVLMFSIIAGGLQIRTLHLSTYMDVESKIFSYKYLRWFKYWEYRGQVLCSDRYCMEVMGHPVHVEGGQRYAELTRSDLIKHFGDSISISMCTIIKVPYFRIEIGKCVCSVVRYLEAPGYVSFYIDSKVHDATSRSYRGCMSETCQERFLALLTCWGEGMISFVSSKPIREGRRSAHCASLVDIFLWFADDPCRSLDDISDRHTFKVRRLGCGFENGLWLVHDK